MEAATSETTTTRARPARVKKKPARPRTPWWLWLAVAVIVVFCLFPFYWLINVSLKTGPDLASSDLFPPNPSLDNYQAIFKNGDFTRALLNSAIVSIITTVLALDGRGVLRLRAGPAEVQGQVLAARADPVDHDVPGDRDRSADLQAVDRHRAVQPPFGLGLIPPYLTFALPLAIYILTSFFKEIPKDLEEAALVDGATNFQAFYKIVIPLAAPGLATAGILTFIFAWNEFLLAVTLTSSPEARTVPAAIAFFTGATQFEVPMGTISAASVVISIPLIVMVLVFQKRIVAGLTAGAVKG